MPTYTERELLVIAKTRALIPENWSVNTSDQKILAYAEVVLSEINYFPPLTGYTIASAPDQLLPVLYFGIALFAEMFAQMQLSIEDFDYNDNGLSVRTDFVGKIGQSYANMLDFYKNMIINFKKTQIFIVSCPVGLGSPTRTNSVLGSFLRTAFGYTWNA